MYTIQITITYKLYIFQLSWADLYFVSLLGYLNYTTEKDLGKEYPNIGVLQKNVEDIPSIKSWLEKRPVTDF